MEKLGQLKDNTTWDNNITCIEDVDLPLFFERNKYEIVDSIVVPVYLYEEALRVLTSNKG